MATAEFSKFAGILSAVLSQFPRSKHVLISWLWSPSKVTLEPKKIRDTKGTFHAKMGSIKDKNSMDLTEAEDTKKRWQEYTELYKEGLNGPDNHQ